MLVEVAYRAATAGFFGALTQAFRIAEPRWLAGLVAFAGIAAVSHAIEFGIHWIRGTPNLGASMLASMIFTLVSTLFSLHTMRHGVLIVGSGAKTLPADLRSYPKMIVTFIGSGLGLTAPSRTGRKGTKD